jgi:hypothetical protein
MEKTENKSEKKNKIIFWTTISIFSLIMLLSAWSYFINPLMKEAFKHFGFPDYFRVELAIAKIIGVIALLIPAVPLKIKEWAYCGFGITLISATIAHFCSGDKIMALINPLSFLVLLIISNIYSHKINKVL